MILDIRCIPLFAPSIIKYDTGLITQNSGPMLNQTLSLVDCLKLCI